MYLLVRTRRRCRLLHWGWVPPAALETVVQVLLHVEYTEVVFMIATPNPEASLRWPLRCSVFRAIIAADVTRAK
jgi:hypothetical protein